MQPNPLYAFLETADGQKLLRRCAALIRQWMKNAVVPGNLYGCDEEDDIAGEIVLLILEREGLRQELEEAAVNGNYPGLRGLIVTAFKRHVLDQRRSSRSNAWHAMYRKVVRLLARRQGFVLHGGREGSWYGPGNIVSNNDALITNPAHHDYSAWPNPTWDLQAGLEANLEQAAGQFWNFAAQSAKRSGLVAVRDLLAWLEAKGALDMQSRGLVLESELSRDGQPCIEEMASVPSSLPLERDALTRLAERIVAAWKPEMAQAFHLVHGEGRKQADAAKMMGYASAAGVNYPLRQAVLNLRKMSTVWPELFEDDRSQEFFLECILAKCKSRTTSTNGR